MKILERYILAQLVKNLFLAMVVFSSLFLIFDFFDRIDNLISDRAGFWISIEYFILKIPLTLTLMLPVATLVSTLFTLGLLAKNSEITAMRASGIRMLWLARPLFAVGLSCSFLSIIWNETAVPYATRRVKEIYNIDIRQKDQSGSYNQNDFWWRKGNDFFSVGMFDSRTKTLHTFSRFDISDEFQVTRRTEASSVEWVDPLLGWSMKNVVDYRFSHDAAPEVRKYHSLPLPIRDRPESFYDVRAQPETMSFRELRRFIRRMGEQGLSIRQYLPDLYEKLAFPFVNFIVVLVVIPFAMKPARSGSMAISILAALAIGFSYYVVHSFSIALGRAEIWHPFVAAWMANVILGSVGLILNLGAESPA